MFFLSPAILAKLQLRFRFYMPVDFIIVVATVLVVWLLFVWLINVVKASVSTALKIAFIVLILQLFFSVKPQDLAEEISQLWQKVWQLFTNGL